VTRIAILRAASCGANIVIYGAVPLLLGLAWPWAPATAAVCSVLSYLACGLRPRCEPAPPEVWSAAQRVAQALGAAPPRAVHTVAGWTAAALRVRGGYDLLVGEEVGARHLSAVLAHEVVHSLERDLFWEPFTDGPARLVLHLSRPLPPLALLALPFLPFAVPLARATELRADRLAAGAIEGYAEVLRELSSKLGPPATLLYPSLSTRIRYAENGAT